MAIQEQGNKTSSRLSLLIDEISNNPPLIAKIKQDPEREIRNLVATILMDHPAPITPEKR